MVQDGPFSGDFRQFRQCWPDETRLFKQIQAIRQVYGATTVSVNPPAPYRAQNQEI